MKSAYDILTEALDERDEAERAWVNCPWWRRNRKNDLEWEYHFAVRRVHVLQDGYRAAVRACE